jgi:hypothetical protein
MTRKILNLLLISAVLFTGCASRESHLIGKWQSETDPSTARKSSFRLLELQFEFFKDGTVVQNEKTLGKWMQVGTGAYSFIDPDHLKIAFGQLVGATVYATQSPDNDHLKLQAGDQTIQLVRISGK